MSSWILSVWNYSRCSVDSTLYKHNRFKYTVHNSHTQVKCTSKSVQPKNITNSSFNSRNNSISISAPVNSCCSNTLIYQRVKPSLISGKAWSRRQPNITSWYIGYSDHNQLSPSTLRWTHTEVGSSDNKLVSFERQWRSNGHGTHFKINRVFIPQKVLI